MGSDGARGRCPFPALPKGIRWRGAPQPGPLHPPGHRPRRPGTVNRPVHRRIRAGLAMAPWNRPERDPAIGTGDSLGLACRTVPRRLTAGSGKAVTASRAGSSTRPVQTGTPSPGMLWACPAFRDSGRGPARRSSPSSVTVGDSTRTLLGPPAHPPGRIAAQGLAGPGVQRDHRTRIRLVLRRLEDGFRNPWRT